MRFFHRMVHDPSTRFTAVTGFLIGVVVALFALRIIEFVVHGS